MVGDFEEWHMLMVEPSMIKADRADEWLVVEPLTLADLSEDTPLFGCSTNNTKNKQTHGNCKADSPRAWLGAAAAGPAGAQTPPPPRGAQTPPPPRFKAHIYVTRAFLFLRFGFQTFKGFISRFGFPRFDFQCLISWVWFNVACLAQAPPPGLPKTGPPTPGAAPARKAHAFVMRVFSCSGFDFQDVISSF
jgi:hypothetical protein